MNIKCFDKYNKIFNFRLDPSVHIVFYKRLVQVKYGSVLEDWIRTRTRLSGEDACSSAFILGVPKYWTKIKMRGPE